jgi:peroxiredoxin
MIETNPTSTPAAVPLPAGTPAPDFRLKRTPDQFLTLSELRGHPVVLVFYPADWSPVCGDQLVVYNEQYAEFEKHQASIVGISVDSAWCHVAYAKDRKLQFPIVSDFEPKGEVARQYGVYRAGDGTAERALFVLDGEGIIRWSHVSPVGVNPGIEGILKALEELSTREVAS